VPGQYVTIGMNREVIDGEDDPRPPSVRRPMSIASAPEDEDEVEVYIRRVSTPESDLPLTHVMWPIREGDRMYCRAAATGKFTLRDTVGEDDPRLKIMVAAGTGLAPFISIARSRVRQDPNARLDDLAILHGASYPTSLGYREELDMLVRKHGLKYLPTISRPDEADKWTGFVGRVESLLAPTRIGETEKALGLGAGELRPDRATILICGLQGTIANTIISLLPRGYVPDHRKIRRELEVEEGRPATIFWEQYDTVPVIDVKDAALMADLRRQVQDARG
jgi:ferredoxin-NADP reductase